MFSAPPANYDCGTFRAQVIHFGGSMKGLEFEEVDVWIAKFEELLRKLYWFSAVAHILPEIDCPYRFTWHPVFVPGRVRAEHGELIPVTEWEREKVYGDEVVESA